MRIWKYAIKITDEQILHLPRGYKILSVANQTGVLCMWVLVTPEHEERKVCVRIVGTGNPMPNMFGFKFLDSVVISSFVWHVFVAGMGD